MPLALGLFLAAVVLVGVVSAAKASGIIKHTKFTIGQTVLLTMPTSAGGGQGPVKITGVNPISPDNQGGQQTYTIFTQDSSQNSSMTNVPESALQIIQ